MRRIIEITGDIDARTGVDVVKLVLETVDDDDIDEIVLLITSSGGNVETISPIYEALKMADKKVIAIGMQRVMSAAATIFMMADRRILFPNTKFLVHKNLSCFIQTIVQ